MGDWTRPLTGAEARLVAAARRKAELLYEGRVTAHRSCGIAMAETFSRPSASYQALRRGGITGTGETEFTGEPGSASAVLNKAKGLPTLE